MKQKKLGVVLLAGLLLFTGCQGKEQQGEQEQTESGTVQTNVSKRMDLDAGEDEQSKKMAVLKDGKAWGELETVGKDDAVYCNLSENIKGMNNLVLVCPDPVYGITYFVNYGEDNYIYAKKDGRTELVVEIPAKRLFCREGILYFMVDSSGKYNLEGIKDGNTLTYNPVDGAVSILDAEEMTSMIVYQDEIVYVKELGVEEIGGGYFIQLTENAVYTFATGEMTQIESMSGVDYMRWQDYRIVYELVDVQVEDLEPAGMQGVPKTKVYYLAKPDGTKERALGFTCFPVFYLKGDMAYEVEQFEEESTFYDSDGKLITGYVEVDCAELIVSDMNTGEQKIYPMPHGEGSWDEYFVYQDEMYFGDFYSYSLTEECGSFGYAKKETASVEEGTLTEEVWEENYYDVDSDYRVLEYYTDGEVLYGVIGNWTQEITEGVIYQLERIKKPVAQEWLDESYTYMYQLSAPVEK